MTQPHNIIYCLPYTIPLTSQHITIVQHLLTQCTTVWIILYTLSDKYDNLYAAYSSAVDVLRRHLTTEQYQHTYSISLILNTNTKHKLLPDITDRMYYIDNQCSIELVQLLQKHNEKLIVEPETQETLSPTVSADNKSRFKLFDNIQQQFNNIQQLPGLAVNTTINSISSTVNQIANAAQPITSAPSKLYNMAATSLRSSSHDKPIESQYTLSEPRIETKIDTATPTSGNLLNNIRSYVPALPSPLLRPTALSQSGTLSNTVPLPPVSISDSATQQHHNTDDEND